MIFFLLVYNSPFRNLSKNLHVVIFYFYREYGRVPSEELCAEAKDGGGGLIGWIFADKLKSNPGDPLVTLIDNILIGLATKTKRQDSDGPLRFARISSYREWINKNLEAPNATTTESPITTKIK
nr:unnamed protein product [Callosobruchus analis]